MSGLHLDGWRLDACAGAWTGCRIDIRIEGLWDVHTGAITALTYDQVSQICTLTGCVLMLARELEQAAALAFALRDCGISAQVPSPRKRQPW